MSRFLPHCTNPNANWWRLCPLKTANNLPVLASCFHLLHYRQLKLNRRGLIQIYFYILYKKNRLFGHVIGVVDHMHTTCIGSNQQNS